MVTAKPSRMFSSVVLKYLQLANMQIRSHYYLISRAGNDLSGRGANLWHCKNEKLYKI